MKSTKLLILNDRQCFILLKLLSSSAKNDSSALEKALPIEDFDAIKAEEIELVDLLQRYPAGSELSIFVNNLTLNLLDKFNLVRQLEDGSETLWPNTISNAN